MRKKVLVTIISVGVLVSLLTASFLTIHKGNVRIVFLIFPPIYTVDYTIVVDDFLLFHDTITDRRVTIFKDCFFL